MDACKCCDKGVDLYGPGSPSVAAYEAAVLDGADAWVPACGGVEMPFTVDGTRYLRVYNPGRREHGYLNMNTDVVEVD